MLDEPTGQAAVGGDEIEAAVGRRVDEFAAVRRPVERATAVGRSRRDRWVGGDDELRSSGRGHDHELSPRRLVGEKRDPIALW